MEHRFGARKKSLPVQGAAGNCRGHTADGDVRLLLACKFGLPYIFGKHMGTQEVPFA